MAKILVVEDNHLNMKLFVDLLEIKNHDVIQSYNGVGIYEITQKEHPDLILMDIQLSSQTHTSNNITGLDLIEMLKKNPNTSHIPIIAVTAFAMLHDRDRIMRSGCELYLSKPVSLEAFFEAVDKYTKHVSIN